MAKNKKKKKPYTPVRFIDPAEVEMYDKSIAYYYCENDRKVKVFPAIDGEYNISNWVLCIDSNNTFLSVDPRWMVDHFEPESEDKYRKFGNAELFGYKYMPSDMFNRFEDLPSFSAIHLKEERIVKEFIKWFPDFKNYFHIWDLDFALTIYFRDRPGSGIFYEAVKSKSQKWEDISFSHDCRAFCFNIAPKGLKEFLKWEEIGTEVINFLNHQKDAVF